MSSLCLLSVDDVYEQDGLAAECLMVHKIKPRLSAAQRLPSGSHVVEACWEYKFRAHGQVNAPPPRAPRHPSPGSRQARPGPAGGARAACASWKLKRARRGRVAWPWGHPRPPRLAGLGRIARPREPVPLLGQPLRPGSWEHLPASQSFPSRWASGPVSLCNPPLYLPYFLGLFSFCLSLHLLLSRVLPCLSHSPRFLVSLCVPLPLWLSPAASVCPSVSRGPPGSPGSPSPLSLLPALAATALQRGTSSL